MAIQILLNVFLASLWMFLTSTFTLPGFIIGYIIGVTLIFLMRRFFHKPFYLNRIWAFVKLFFIFIRELILANIEVLLLVIQPRLSIQPAIFALPTELKDNWEISLLASLITLTPGTIVLNISHDQQTLYIHALHSDDIEEAIDSIKNSFEKAILEVSRS